MTMKPPLHFIGMFGIGDCLHQRDVIRWLMQHYDVWLETCHVWIHHDLLDRGLKLILRPTALWMHAQNIEREQRMHPGVYRSVREVPRGAHVIRNWYHKHQIDVHGSIVETMRAVSGLPTGPADFRLPLKPEWVERAQELVAHIKRGDPRPLAIYRPVVLRREWDGKMRNPDPVAYEQLYDAPWREKFFTISLASLRKDVEWIVGREQPADYKIHDGSLDMWIMAALIQQADVVFCNAGMAPVLAQAVGTPSVVVYGGRESFRTTQRAGAHLAPTLGIDPVNPCDCHSHTHHCDKRIDVQSALPRIESFMEDVHARAAVRNDLRRHTGEARCAEPVVQDG